MSVFLAVRKPYGASLVASRRAGGRRSGLDARLNAINLRGTESDCAFWEGSVIDRAPDHHLSSQTVFKQTNYALRRSRQRRASAYTHRPANAVVLTVCTKTGDPSAAAGVTPYVLPRPGRVGTITRDACCECHPALWIRRGAKHSCPATQFAAPPPPPTATWQISSAADEPGQRPRTGACCLMGPNTVRPRTLMASWPLCIRARHARPCRADAVGVCRAQGRCPSRISVHGNGVGTDVR